MNKVEKRKKEEGTRLNWIQRREVQLIRKAHNRMMKKLEKWQEEGKINKIEKWKEIAIDEIIAIGKEFNLMPKGSKEKLTDEEIYEKYKDKTIKEVTDALETIIQKIEEF